MNKTGKRRDWVTQTEGMGGVREKSVLRRLAVDPEHRFPFVSALPTTLGTDRPEYSALKEQITEGNGVNIWDGGQKDKKTSEE
jgi:hypothetical protein